MYIRKVPIVCDLSTNISTCIALHSQSYEKMLRNCVITPNICHENCWKERKRRFLRFTTYKSISNAIDCSIQTLVEERLYNAQQQVSMWNILLIPLQKLHWQLYRESYFINNPFLNRSNDYDGSPNLSLFYNQKCEQYRLYLCD